MNRNQLFYILSLIGAATGLHMFVYFLVVIGNELYESEAASGNLFFLLIIPILIFGATAGNIIDRGNKLVILRFSVLFTSIFVFLISFAIGDLEQHSEFELLIVAALVFLSGISMTFSLIARYSLMGDIAKDKVKVFASISSLVVLIFFFLGTLLSGICIEYFEFVQVPIAISCVFLLNCLFTFAIRIENKSVEKASEGGVFYIVKSSLEIRRMLLLSLVPSAVGGAFRVLVTLYGEESLNLGYISTASLFLPSILGTLIGHLVALRLIKAVKAIKMVMIAGFVCTLSFMFIGYISNIYYVTFLIFLSGAAGGLAGNLTFAHYHSILGETQRGRANAAYNIISNLFVAISGLLSGWLAELYGIEDGIIYMGFILAVLFLMIGGALSIDYRKRAV